MIRISLQQEDFDLGAETQPMQAGNVGAVVTFTGYVRDVDERLKYMEIEHYPGMTEASLHKISEQAFVRWSLAQICIIHRYGRLVPGAQIMMVATAARHRSDAFLAAEFLMDYLKSRAPFWKKEVTEISDHWVAARAEDEDALSRW